MLIYMVINKINYKMYIGQTVNSLKQRKQEHIRAALNKTDTMYFHSAIRKYGPENFEWEILDSARNIDELNELEIFFIKLFKTFGSGYNLNEGGWNSITSDETRKKISKIHKGKPWSEDHRKKMSGKKHPLAKPVIINNKHFDTLTQASKFLKIPIATVHYRLKKQKPGYQHVCQKEI